MDEPECESETSAYNAIASPDDRPPTLDNIPVPFASYDASGPGYVNPGSRASHILPTANRE